jgi:hypothetical protein
MQIVQVRDCLGPTKADWGQTWPSLAFSWAEHGPMWAKLGRNFRETNLCPIIGSNRAHIRHVWPDLGTWYSKHSYTQTSRQQTKQAQAFPINFSYRQHGHDRSRTHKMVRHSKVHIWVDWLDHVGALGGHYYKFGGTALEAECSNAFVKLPRTSWFRGGHQTGCWFAGYLRGVFQLHVVGESMSELVSRVAS